MARWHVACGRCEAGAWIGARDGARDAWCEACQAAAVLPAGDGESPCTVCGAPLTTGELRFEELFGELQNLAAVLEAWQGDGARLDAILPERPRYLTDLNPPAARPGDDRDTRAALERLAAGAFADARARLERLVERAPGSDRLRLRQALGVACERLGDLTAAEAAFSRALDHGEDPAVRLARGALRARREAFHEAREDLGQAGDTREAGWNRAAVRLADAVAVTPGLPTPEVLKAAREEAGAPSAYWSDHTVGRLLWTLLVERAEARRAAARADAAGCVDVRVMRAAEGEFEFATFWDRAMVVLGYQALGMAEETAERAGSLAREHVEALAAEPCLRGAPAAPIAARIAAAAEAIRAGRPGDADREIRGVMERDDVRHYRLPCAACGEGTVGVDRVEDE